ncbi:cell surface protein [Xylariaceae sp. FL0594]|nr:cell surface protein [Xylariaceae sp. FL0594]
MHWSHILVASGLLAGVSGHGLVTSIQGANGVTMPGLSVADGTPRDCSSNGCGSQADTSIIRDREIRSGKASALGRTQGNGPVDAKVMISNFMGAATAPTNKGAASSSGVEDDLSALKGISGNDSNSNKTKKRGFFGDLFNNITGGGGNKGTKSNQAAETAVAASAGKGAQSGLPTCADDGSITMTFRQINQDGAGPLFADVDGTSGGTDPAAFQKAEVTQDVPGVPIAGGLSLATKTDFPLTVQMPPGMTCEATVAGVKNVCVVRVRNKAIAGPFGGSAAFTMSHAAQKRALEYRLKKRTEEETGAQNKHRRLRLY